MDRYGDRWQICCRDLTLGSCGNWVNSVCKVLSPCLLVKSEDPGDGLQEGQTDIKGEGKNKGKEEPVRTSLELLMRKQNLYQFSLPPPGQGRVLLEKLTPLTHPWNSTHTWIRNWRSWRGTQEMVEQVSQRLFPNDMNQIKNLNALPWPSKHENKRLLSPSKSPFILLVNTSESGRWHRVKATHSLKGSHPQPQFFICFWRYHCYSKLYFTMFIWQNFPRLYYEKKENNYFNQFWIMTVHLKV